MDRTFRIIRWSDHAYFFCCFDNGSFCCSNLNASQIHDVCLSQNWYQRILNLDVFICRYLLKKILHRFPRWGWSDWCCWSILQRMLLSDWNHSVYDSFMCFECWLLWIEYQNEHSAGWWIVIILREWLVRVPFEPLSAFYMMGKTVLSRNFDKASVISDLFLPRKRNWTADGFAKNLSTP